MAAKGQPRRYHRGYPDRVRREGRVNWFVAGPTLLGCGAFLLLVTLLAVRDIIYVWGLLREDITILRLVLMAFLIPITGYLLVLAGMMCLAPFSWIFLLFRRPRIDGRVIPLFEKNAGIPWRAAKVDGHALAKNAEGLDALLIAHGATPLSALGLDDDLVSRKLLWHDPAEGLAPLEVLRREVEKNPADWEEVDLLLKEIDVLTDALKVAEEKRTGFCLSISLGAELRRGHEGHWGGWV